MTSSGTFDILDDNSHLAWGLPKDYRDKLDVAEQYTQRLGTRVTFCRFVVPGVVACINIALADSLGLFSRESVICLLFLLTYLRFVPAAMGKLEHDEMQAYRKFENRVISYEISYRDAAAVSLADSLASILVVIDEGGEHLRELADAHLQLVERVDYRIRHFARAYLSVSPFTLTRLGIRLEDLSSNEGTLSTPESQRGATKSGPSEIVRLDPAPTIPISPPGKRANLEIGYPRTYSPPTHQPQLPLTGQPDFLKIQPSGSNTVDFPVDEVPFQGELDFAEIKRLAPSNVDWMRVHATRQETGQIAENHILLEQKKRLQAIGRADLASKVTHVSKDIGDGLGYDILSYSTDGTEIYIEVKACRGKTRLRFRLSKKELEVLRQNESLYWIYLVNLDNSNNVVGVHPIRGDCFDRDITFVPSLYRGTILKAIGKQGQPKP